MTFPATFGTVACLVAVLFGGARTMAADPPITRARRWLETSLRCRPVADERRHMNDSPPTTCRQAPSGGSTDDES